MAAKIRWCMLLLCCISLAGEAAGLRGRLQAGGLERSYLLHTPAGGEGGGMRPLIIVLHGGLGSGQRMLEQTRGRFNELADRDGFLVAYPDGIDRHWNDGRQGVPYRAHRDNVDDVGFIAALIDKLVREQRADPDRVYVTGVSNGAMMSFRLGCELADRLAAIAPLAGSLVTEQAARCQPARPLPLLMINSTDDQLVPWEGGSVRFGRRKLGNILSVPEAIARWLAFNGCHGGPTVTRDPDRDPDDGTRVRREHYSGCPRTAEVVLLAIEGGGHTWPGGSPYLGEGRVGKVSREIDAAEEVWTFFRRHARAATAARE